MLPGMGGLDVCRALRADPKTAAVPIIMVTAKVDERDRITGLELARKVRDRYPELPILLTTGYSEQVAGSHGFEVLPKPYELSLLSVAVQKVVKQGVGTP